MTNRTNKSATFHHGSDPQNLIEYIVRQKIYGSMYWKQFCFGLSAETLVDNAVSIKIVGGTIGGQRRPTDFLCLILKMLQIQPSKETYLELILSEDYKYARLLGAFYLRLIGNSMEIYQYVEPLLSDYRKIRIQDTEGLVTVSHVDEIIDELLTKDVVFDITLPRIQPRFMLENHGYLTSKSFAFIDNENKFSEQIKS
eukprot:gnl/MRDRNA2_/MRDRNA2_86671_c0_seq1.p1 gnl/MRDRNA2_/MRDRNA2_86671_c0~~gnl/MRDRNA2_/MRDRNA2_86671_c0_seq1.p1  ORF type:complete len:198 (+),score=4.46 gnl/MRDRNA2_/MRDRNA2_86671_c0_seq1:175-768(+)